MIDKRAPLSWVEAQDQPRRGAGENENGAPSAILSTQPPQKPPDTTTTASRNNTVICPHLGKKHDTFNTTYHTKNNTATTASDKKHKSEVTTESAGLAPSGAGLRHSVRLTLDAARRKGLPQPYRALGRIRPQISPWGQRPKATNQYYTERTQHSSKRIPRIIHALLCCACLNNVLNTLRTHAPSSDKHSTREIQNPHSACTGDSQEGIKLFGYKKPRQDDNVANGKRTKDPAAATRGEREIPGQRTHKTCYTSLD
jgi:hypothetical protein